MNLRRKEQGKKRNERERMKERDLKWREEIKGKWEMIGAGVGAARVVRDLKPKTSRPMDVKTDWS